MPAPQRKKKSEPEIKSQKEYSSAFAEEIYAERAKERGKEGRYVRFARTAARYFKAPEQYKKEEYRAAVEFMGWDLKAKEVNAAPTMALALALLVAVPIIIYLMLSVFIWNSLPFMLFTYLVPVLVMIPFGLVFYVQNYPVSAAKSEKIRALMEIPEIINYIVMSMKLTPNLEKALDFASEHGKGKIAKDLKQLVWDSSVGVYGSLEEGLDQFAYKWGRYSDEFKHALMLIRSSVIEVDEGKRNSILDKAVADTLSGIEAELTKYATNMRQPSIYLYYFGVLLPLMLIIMLPIGSIMAGLPFAQTWILILIYNLAIPIGTFLFARNIISKKPAVYTPPKVPKDYPGLPRAGSVKIGKTEVPALVLAGFIAVVIYFAISFIEPVLNPVPPSWNEAAFKAWFPFFGIAGFVMGGISGVSVYLFTTTYPRRRVQRKLMKLENEFQDSIYIIASRLGENRPLEEAMGYASNFLGKSDVSDIYAKASDNISNLGMTAEMALFDPVYGALKNIPSDVIRGSMKIVISSMQLGVQQAARALMSLSLQLRDSQKMKQTIIDLLGEVTSMMKSIAFLIAPIVLGITTALQKIIINAMGSMTQLGTTTNSVSIPGVNIPTLPFAKAGAMTSLQQGGLFGIPDPLTFLAIIGLYVVQVTIILIYFTSRVQEGKNNLALKMELAQSLPLAMTFFFLAAFMGTQIASAAG